VSNASVLNSHAICIMQYCLEAGPTLKQLGSRFQHRQHLRNYSSPAAQDVAVFTKKNALWCQKPILQGNCCDASLLQKDTQLLLSVAPVGSFRTTPCCIMRQRATVTEGLHLANTLLEFQLLTCHKNMLFRVNLRLELRTPKSMQLL
jgi:hypothetical protein